jgi:hypothetical protein
MKEREAPENVETPLVTALGSLGLDIPSDTVKSVSALNPGMTIRCLQVTPGELAEKTTVAGL